MRPVRIRPLSRTTSSGALAARTRDSAGASSASASSRARGRSPLMRSTLDRSLPIARSRGARPSSTQPTTSGTIVSRNDSESAACTRSASGQPPSSCTRTSPATSRASVVGGAALAQAVGDHVRAAVLVPAVVLGRVPVAGRVPARRAVRVRALDVVRDGRDPHRLGGVGVEHEQPVERALEVVGVRVHVGDPLLRALEHHAVTGLAWRT